MPPTSIKMQLVEDYREYFDSFFVCSPLTFSFLNPRDLLNKLTGLSGKTHFINRVDILPKLKKGNEAPESFNGWLVSYGINEKMISHFSKTGYVYVKPHWKENMYESLLFFKHVVFIFGYFPFTPLVKFNSYLHHEKDSLNNAIDLSTFEINERRRKLKKLLSLFNSKAVYYFTNNNEALFKIFTDPMLNQKEQMKLLKQDFKVVPFSFQSLKQINKSNEQETIFFDKLLV